MFRIRKPSVEVLRRFRESQSKLDFTYAEVGATATGPPANYTVDHTRTLLGSGEAVFHAARRALTQWRQFALGWLKAWPADTPIRAGETAVVVGRAMGLWSLNAARIVYIVEESSEAQTRFGFAYGTLPGHIETGEERFLVEWDHTKDEVFFDILAFSRPRHLLARLGFRQVRRMQKRFGQEAAASMLRAVRASQS